MKPSLCDHQEPCGPEELLGSIRQAVEEFYRGFEVKPVIENLSDCCHQFFLECPDGLIWVRIFNTPLTRRNLECFTEEANYFIKSMREKVQAYVFFPSFTHEVVASFRSEGMLKKEDWLHQSMRFFQYSIQESVLSRPGCVCLKEWRYDAFLERGQKKVPLSGEDHTLPRHESRDVSCGIYFPFLSQMRLSREELTDLLELSLELKRHAVAS